MAGGETETQILARLHARWRTMTDHAHTGCDENTHCTPPVQVSWNGHDHWASRITCNAHGTRYLDAGQIVRVPMTWRDVT